MDPFSITVGALALAETANKLASSLTDRYRAFSSAPREMLEIAGQVTMCAGLVDVFARSVEQSGEGFPKRFQQDASTLVKQCRVILKNIDDMIPHGSKKPDYAERLKFAFGSQKKIAKHQENLKQVQHMFMFMTTCWQYQLPSRQPPATAAIPSPAPTIPMGSLQGVLKQIPVQINMTTTGNESQTITYEATLTLKPVEQRPNIIQRPSIVQSMTPDGAPLGSSRDKKSHIASREAKFSNREKQTLENMRRSPYFSMKLLKPTVVTMNKESHRRASSYRMRYDGEEDKERREYEDKMKWEMEEKKMMAGDPDSELAQKVPKGKPEGRVKPPSKEEASEEVDNILSQWFDEDPEPESDSDGYDSFSEHKETVVEPNDEPPLTEGEVEVFENPFRPRSVPLPEHQEWDWICDGCDRGFYFHDRRFMCRDCSNFDLCPDCYGVVGHRHGSLSFVEQSI